MHRRVQLISSLLRAGSQPDHGPALPGVHGAEHLQAPGPPLPRGADCI